MPTAAPEKEFSKTYSFSAEKDFGDLLEVLRCALHSRSYSDVIRTAVKEALASRSL